MGFRVGSGLSGDGLGEEAVEEVTRFETWVANAWHWSLGRESTIVIRTSASVSGEERSLMVMSLEEKKGSITCQSPNVTLHREALDQRERIG